VQDYTYLSQPVLAGASWVVTLASRLEALMALRQMQELKDLL